MSKEPDRLLGTDLYWQIMAILKGVQHRQRSEKPDITWVTTLDDAIEKLKDVKTASMLKVKLPENPFPVPEGELGIIFTDTERLVAGKYFNEALKKIKELNPEVRWE